MATDQYGEAQPGPVLQSHLVTIRKLHRLGLPFQACHFKRMDPHALFLFPRKKELEVKKKKTKGQIGLCSRVTKTRAVPSSGSVTKLSLRQFLPCNHA